MRNLQIQYLFLIIYCLDASTPLFEKSMEYQCDTKQKLDCSGPVCTCSCDDNTKCIWTNSQAIQGCPCKATQEHNYGFIQQAKLYGCNDQKFECQSAFCHCSCVDGSICMFTNDKPMMGCPCKVRKQWEEPVLYTREEIQNRRNQREQQRAERQKQREIERQEQLNNENTKYHKVQYEDI